MDKVMNYINDLPIYFKTSLFLIGVLIVLSYFVGRKISKLDVREKPNKFLTIFISFIEFFNNYIKANIGKHWRYVAPLTLTMALYVFISNISGIWGLEAPTKFTAITFSLSIIAFIVVQSTGFVSRSWKHLLGIFSPLPPMAPLNLISEFTPILSMALRLFGNIASGALISNFNL
jgi:F-type H+-transporting ATPase subunit a